jgi:hypothetical protein
MEPITTTTIAISVGFGAILGFVTMCTGNPGVKLAVDAAGAVALLFFIWAIMPTITWGTPTLEGAESTVDFIIRAVPALVFYVVGDAFGTAGYMAVTGSRG